MPRWIPRLTYEITVAPGQITVSDGRERVEVEPRVCVSDDGRVLGVGDESPAERGRVITLFQPAGSEEPLRFDALVALFRYLLSLLQERNVFKLRPWVRVHGVAALRPLLNGYEQEVIRQALLRSGAANVEFT